MGEHMTYGVFRVEILYVLEQLSLNFSLAAGRLVAFPETGSAIMTFLYLNL